MEESIRLRGSKALIEDWVFLALAHHDLGHANADAYLSKARLALAQRRSATPNPPASPVPLRELEATLLVREAIAALRAKREEKER